MIKDSIVNKPKLAFIGGGNMATSLIGGLLEKGFCSKNITVSDPLEKNLSQLSQKFGVNTTSDNSVAARNTDLVVLSIKPQILQSVCKALVTSLKNMPPMIGSH